jgi:hypothetical protein
MTRFVPVTVLVVVLAASGVAGADDTAPTGPLSMGASITFNELKIHEDNSADLAFPKISPDSLWHYFNLAHCQCSAPGAGTTSDFREVSFAYLLQLTGATTAVSRPLEVWVGANCNTDAARPPSTTATCHRIDSAGQSSVDILTSPGNVRPEIPVFDFMTPTPGATMCTPTAGGSDTVWVLVDTNGNNLPDYSNSVQITTDSLPPPLPTGISGIGGDGAIVLSWKPPADVSDVYAYQALCARDDSPGRSSDQPTQRYMTALSLCGLESGSITLMPTDISPAPGAPPPSPVSLDSLPADMKNLDPMFLCGENLTPTATSLRIGGLDNGVAYKVVLLTIDKFQNSAGTYLTSTITPVVSTDLWEDLHDRGSTTDGGLCLLAETYGDDSPLTGALRSFRDGTLASSAGGRWLTAAYYATLAKLGVYVHGSVALRVVAAIGLAPVVALALLWHWLTLPGVLVLIAAAWLWCRRRALVRRWARRLVHSRTVQGAAVIAAVVFGTSRANAGGFQPYWEDTSVNGDENQSLADEPGLVDWHVGIRVGPYVPDIDKQLGGTSPGPYEQMFGGYHVLPMLDVDRILWRGFGQVGVGLSLGYMQKSARAFSVIKQPDGTLMTNYSQRSGDTNNFRLIPTELTATYRFTWLDDQYSIPVVPYARAGLAYYVWWISTPSGYARVCGDSGTEPTCSQNKALGASLGVTGAIGLAVRAERIDAAAALSMRQSGIQHAGLYGELSLAKVDGFGSDTKLSVGARTWFAGVDFEF